MLETDDPAALPRALRQVAQAHGMAELARQAELGEKTLFKALSEDGNPTIVTGHKVPAAVGLRPSGLFTGGPGCLNARSRYRHGEIDDWPTDDMQERLDALE